VRRRADIQGEPARDRRVPFFLIFAVASFVLYYPTPEKFRWVPLWLGITYVVLAALTALDQWSRDRS
jgi:hypothetical protein